MVWFAIGIAGCAALLGILLYRRMQRRRRALMRKIVILRPEVTADSVTKTVNNLRGQVHEHLPLVNGVSCTLPKPEGFTALAASEDILRIDDDIRVRINSAPCRWRYSLRLAPSPRAVTIPWGIARIKAPDAWPRSQGSGAKVAVLDTGVWLTHPDLAPAIAGGANLVRRGQSANDDNGHGTHVAGIIAARNNGRNMVGVAPQAQLFAVKVLDRSGGGYLSDIIKGLSWCIDNDIDVVNMSFGSADGNETFAEAIAKAEAAGITLVAAAGNSGPAPNTVDYPAKYPEVTSVAATTSSDQIASFSSRGAKVDVAAPGKSIISTWLKGSYQTLDGTSMATPHVAGVAALIVSAVRGIAPAKVREALKASATPLPGFGPDAQGAGLISAPKALNVAGTNASAN